MISKANYGREAEFKLVISIIVGRYGIIDKVIGNEHTEIEFEYVIKNSS